MIGTKIHKTYVEPTEAGAGGYYEYDNKLYFQCSEWCDNNNATIEDKGDYYEVVAIPEPTLEELKAAKLAALKSERDTKEVEPIEYNGNSFDYDEKARDRINAAIIALELQGDSASLAWTTADNTDATVTAADLKNIIAAVAVRSNALHVAYRAAKEQVEAAQTKEDLDAIALEV